MQRSDKTALLIEDDPLFRGLVRDALEAMGFRVAEAADGRAGLAWLERQVPDFLCLDLMLPEIGGHELCETVRRREASRAVPVLMMSARDLPQDRAAAEEVGADGYLVKPFTRDELAAEVRRLIFRPAGRR